MIYNYEDLDLYSRMYPSFQEIQEYLDQNASKPFLLVEYCHSMGNGPGDFEDYFELIHKHDLMCGGFVWEWCDHAVSKGKVDNEKIIYYYGGDHGEAIHGGNFCVDGLVYPDRRPHTGLLEYEAETILEIKIPDKGKVYLKVFYELKKQMGLIPKKHIV